MNKEFENKGDNVLSKQGGFLKTIIIIIIALIILKYFNISLSDAINWLKDLWDSVFN